MKSIVSLIKKAEIQEPHFKKLLFTSGIIAICLLIGIFITLVIKSLLSIKAMGLPFFVGKTWDPVKEIFGALPFLIGTLTTSILALAIALPFSYSLSIFLGEFLKDNIWRSILNSVIELLAGIPSVIYGFWGLFVVVPWVRDFQTSIGVTPNGVGIFSSALILAIMIIPYSVSISKEVIAMVPTDLKEAATGLGATKTEVVTKIILPYAKSGMFAGVLMAFGRAISETMAVTMLIGNSNRIPTSIFSPANTLASVLANEFAEASDALYLSSLVELALILLILTTFFSFIGQIIIKRLVVKQ